ncbi:MAG: linear amide C-N hydrolase [Tissierellia bacterium]|nr:linear amide C-N hydrolase [Tissierellia bacterium]
MCTFFTYENGDHYFGRNMDINTSFGEKFIYLPKNYPLPWFSSRFSIFGVGILPKYPVYFDAVNEKGIAMALLNFENYGEMEEKKKHEIAMGEFILYLLSSCASLEEIREKTKEISLYDRFPLENGDSIPAHFHFIATQDGKSIVIEPAKDGIKIHDNPIGVLTNSPDFPAQMTNLQNYAHLQAENPKKIFGTIDMSSYGQGLGGFSLPGDATPMGRFVRAAYLKYHSQSQKDEKSNVVQIFRILDKVSMLRGEVVVNEKLSELGALDETTYSVCCNLDKKRYYIKTYDQPMIQQIDFSTIHGDEVKTWDIQSDFSFVDITPSP